MPSGLSQTQIILAFISDNNDWTPSHALEKVDTVWGYIGTSGLRRCRELVNEGRLEVKNGSQVGRDRRFAYYRIKQPIGTQATLDFLP